MPARTSARGSHLITLIVGLVIGLVAVGTASAVTSAPAAPAASTKNLAIDSSAFAPDSLRGATNDYFNGWTPASLSNTDVERCFNADVFLPNNATITKITIYYSSDTDGLFLLFTRKNLPANSFGIIAEFANAPTTSGAYGSASQTVSSVVNTAKYSYAIGVCPFGDATFSGAIITYTTG